MYLMIWIIPRSPARVYPSAVVRDVGAALGPGSKARHAHLFAMARSRQVSGQAQDTTLLAGPLY